MANSFERAKIYRDKLENACKLHGDKLRAYPQGPMGLTPDDVRASMAWQNDKALFDLAFKALRSFNAVFVKRFKQDIRAERADRFASSSLTA